MTPDDLAGLVIEAVSACVAAGRFAAEIPDRVTIERPKNPEHGDYATNVALRLAKQAGRPAREVAEAIAETLRTTPGIARADVAGPGFVNVTLAADSLAVLARQIVEGGAAYGRGTAAAGQRVNLEFVSANPTGPVHLGGTRWAAVGDALARILEASGASVTREYYFNDHGAQIDRFARSLLAAAKGEPAPEDGYGGDYIGDIAQQVLATRPDVLDLPDAEAQEVFRAEGVELMFTEVKQSLHDFGVDFDVYFHEDSLHESGAVQKVVQQLKDSGHLYFQDGAWWLRSTEFGDDKDRPVIKSDGNAAYIAGDLAYLRDKRGRGFDLCIFLLGADHHGYVARLKAAAAAFGDDPARRRGADRPDGQPRARRPSGAHEQARRHGHHAGRPRRRGRCRRRPLLPRAFGRSTPRWTSTSTSSSSDRTTTRSSTCSTPTRGRATRSATRPTWASGSTCSCPSC